ncbi:hypothetical protein Mpop_0724 [Methylorubrum populi BJ001]|jgi:hypothetical protein|uniref:Uncharacterized protein n=1 Tax=Methylorubrum populi (strain ATCC BAA-705 / NCIMB 13946 / BJ001) TaxID=441620 RepID=B1Z719_METPB|nr:hypothetical protein [Methylorubrum populi]ACB78902.1 hypothetical protein Mpop_0724 [Methylorubrum populi BJ001]OAH32387.1 hypothetical protein AX289_08100 [Methylorubrum populi]PZP71327.1 MAG: hypothetical protein DI590_06375 [Methylorubrum populi]
MSDEPRLLAEIHAARALMRAQALGAASGHTARPNARPSTRPSHAALWAHADRVPGRPVDLAVVRAIRTDPEIARRYRTLLGAQALAHAPLAAAASDGAIARRRVGPFDLEILEGAPPLLILRGPDASMPRRIEAWLGDEAVRLDLGPPADGAILLALDPSVPEADQLGRMLRDPACAVFLL